MSKIKSLPPRLNGGILEQGKTCLIIWSKTSRFQTIKEQDKYSYANDRPNRLLVKISSGKEIFCWIWQLILMIVQSCQITLKDLGVTLEPDLSFDEHIKTVSRTAFFYFFFTFCPKIMQKNDHNRQRYIVKQTLLGMLSTSTLTK